MKFVGRRNRIAGVRNTSVGKGYCVEKHDEIEVRADASRFAIRKVMMRGMREDVD